MYDHSWGWQLTQGVFFTEAKGLAGDGLNITEHHIKLSLDDMSSVYHVSSNSMFMSIFTPWGRRFWDQNVQ